MKTEWPGETRAIFSPALPKSEHVDIHFARTLPWIQKVLCTTAAADRWMLFIIASLVLQCDRHYRVLAIEAVEGHVVAMRISLNPVTITVHYEKIRDSHKPHLALD
ncbi:hypothetical protein JAK44_19715 [Stenotrophomonas maltophilia]|uniref:hypothetical protein n=1 Tax=Stenotrophomonas TaxID=40323 RepID=UPI0021C5F773|nr:MULTISPECIES: hypothetical protein [Stenotrophomonas]MCU1003164.1 hypothetical protein [Stenotrophomonas maltophilia]